MQDKIRFITLWAPVPAAASLAVFGFALQHWPATAGADFAWWFGLDLYSLQLRHGWAGVALGLLGWLLACQATVALSLATWHLARWLPRPMPARRSALQAER